MSKTRVEGFDLSEYKADFILVLEHILAHFYSIMSKNKYSASKTKSENQIRNILLEILKDKNTRMSNDYVFSAECPVCDENYKEIGYVDLFAINPKHYLSGKEEEYIIECKRLDGNKTLNRKYLTEGVMRFIQGKYVTRHKTYGMIGFLVNKKINPDENIKKINELINLEDIKIECLSEIQKCSISSYNYTYFSDHNSSREIYHLMFDIDSITIKHK